MLGGGAWSGDEVKEEIMVGGFGNGIEGGECHIIAPNFGVKAWCGYVYLGCKGLKRDFVYSAIVFDDCADVDHNFKGV